MDFIKIGVFDPVATITSDRQKAPKASQFIGK